MRVADAASEGMNLSLQKLMDTWGLEKDDSAAVEFLLRNKRKR
jgi:hypothetical protein